MDAFAAGKVDAVRMTMGDALVTGAPGARSVAILVTDYSNGNDMIVAKPGIKGIADLKGKKVAVEHGLVEHLLLRLARHDERANLSGR
jgi:NitT/TauT family transport system substrate-binding protein